MSKRFGRNQKRKMREEMTRLKEEHRYSTIKALNLESRMSLWARQMNSYLGPSHPLNERIQTIVLSRNPVLSDRYRFMKPISFQEIMNQSLEDISIARDYIETVLHLVSVRKDDIGYSVIAELVSQDKQCYYAIDESYLKNGRQDPRFVHWLSKELAVKLSEHISNV
jgi:hypothetical protein